MKVIVIGVPRLARGNVDSRATPSGDRLVLADRFSQHFIEDMRASWERTRRQAVDPVGRFRTPNCWILDYGQRVREQSRPTQYPCGYGKRGLTNEIPNLAGSTWARKAASQIA